MLLIIPELYKELLCTRRKAARRVLGNSLRRIPLSWSSICKISGCIRAALVICRARKILFRRSKNCCDIVMIEKFPWFTCIRPNAKIWPTSASLPISNRRPHDADNQWSNFEGTPGAEIYEPLKPMQDDIVVKKFRYSGFYGTQLENLLRALGRDTIAITGVATNVCCDSTARDGAMRDFKVVFLSD